MASLVQSPSVQHLKISANDNGRELISGLQSAASAVRAAAEADNVLFKKARVFMKCRPKRVLFNISHRLYQSGNLEEDIRQLRCDRYEGVVPPASLIWGERFDQDVLHSSKTLNEDNFWTFVHSVAWRKFSSIRVTEGALLDSLLFAYFSLVQDGKLYSYTTDVFQKTEPTTSHDKADKKDDFKPMKITFTYYAPSLSALSEIIYRHEGSRVSLDVLAQQNENPNKQPTVSPDISLDFAWSAEQKDSRASIGHLPYSTPVNPPNSPTPSRSPTQTMLKKRKDRALLVDRRNENVKYPASYYNLPLVLRNRFTFGMKLKGDDEMAVEGKPLQCRREDVGQFSPCSEVYFTRETDKLAGFKSSFQAVRASYRSRSQAVRLPTLTPAGVPVKDPRKSSLEKECDSATPLHSCLMFPSPRLKEKDKTSPDLQVETPTTRPESKRTLTFSPNLEYINVVHRVTPGPASPKPSGNGVTFDTSKLCINWSLEKVRKAKGRGKYRRKFGPTQKALLKKLQAQDTDKEYVLGKFLAEQPAGTAHGKNEENENCPVHTEQDIKCGQCLAPQRQRIPSPITIITNHSDVRKIRFSPVKTKPAGVSASIAPGYADTVMDFRHGCYVSTEQFIIRKEQMTTSKPLVTVTSLTINKIPRGGFASWQYKTDESMMDK